MCKELFAVAASVTALSAGVAQAPYTTNKNQTASTSQSDGSAAPSTDASAYGGAASKSSSSPMTRATGAQQSSCVGPASF